jgi:hypothetical protein
VSQRDMQSNIERLVNQEPWRVNQGQPKNALDPTWEGVEKQLCDGEVDFESTPDGTTGWWFCSSCGYCSHGTSTAHAPVEHPMHYFFHSLLFYYRRRVVQGLPPTVATNQALFAAGVALRYAAVRPPDQFRGYTQTLAVP